ncbi:MAG: phage tail tip lysozyme [Microlunatus sp.]|nr:phage tail tip lysozyme [Microlunatus sp.]
MTNSIVRRLIGLLAAVFLSFSLIAVASSTPAWAANNNETAYRYFVKKGLKGYQSAGIVGNFIQESGSPINPRANQPNGPGRGIAQWSEGARWDQLVAWARKQGRNPNTLGVQLDYTWRELTTVPAYGLASLRSSGNVTQATQVFMAKFERCGRCESAARVRYAQQVLRRYGGGPISPAPETALPTLRKGSKGSAVTTAQYLLRSRGHRIAADGVFGTKTHHAVVAFQRSRKLNPDGIIGSKTWSALLPTLSRGDKGEAVKGLQKELNASGSKLKVDGVFGAATNAAVRSYQGRVKLARDGIVGRNTWGSLID